MEVLVALAVVLVLVVVTSTIMKRSKAKKNMLVATTKMEEIGRGFKGYVEDSGGLIPLEDAPGKDDWTGVLKPEAAEAWYNVIPKQIGAKALKEMTGVPGEFYADKYPLYFPGALYPRSDKKLSEPYFAACMNSRLHRKDKDENKPRVRFDTILKAPNTVIFFERGLPREKKLRTMKAQKGFDANPKGNPSNFVARYNGKGLLLFADGHVEPHAASNLITKTGEIIEPQDQIVWTPDPDVNPN